MSNGDGKSCFLSFAKSLAVKQLGGIQVQFASPFASLFLFSLRFVDVLFFSAGSGEFGNLNVAHGSTVWVNPPQKTIGKQL